jgi:resolvase-like protein
VSDSTLSWSCCVGAVRLNAHERPVVTIRPAPRPGDCLLGRSLQDLVGFLSELHGLKIDLYLHQQGIDTTTPAGKAMFQMMGVFAEFERSMIQERVRAGLARAKDEGKQLGRPRIARAVEERIREALKGGGSVRKVADRFDVSPGTVQRISRPFEPSVGVAYAGIVSGDEKKSPRGFRGQVNSGGIKTGGAIKLPHPGRGGCNSIATPDP